MLLSAVWTLILTAPIHYRGSFFYFYETIFFGELFFEMDGGMYEGEDKVSQTLTQYITLNSIFSNIHILIQQLILYTKKASFSHQLNFSLQGNFKSGNLFYEIALLYKKRTLCVQHNIVCSVYEENHTSFCKEGDAPSEHNPLQLSWISSLPGWGKQQEVMESSYSQSSTTKQEMFTLQLPQFMLDIHGNESVSKLKGNKCICFAGAVVA